MQNISPRTVASAARLRFTLLAAAILGLSVSGQAQAADPVTGQGNSISFSDTQTAGGMRMIMGAVESKNWDGAAVFFKRNQSTGGWIQDKSVSEGVASSHSHFGSSVSMSGDGTIAVVGASEASSGAGATYIYKYTNNTWQKVSPSLNGKGATGLARQGFSVFINYNGNTIFVGGPTDTYGKGAVWVYALSDGKWTLQQKLVPTGDVGSPPYFGSSISSTWDGNRVVIGGPNDNNGMGASWIFERDKKGKWTQAGNKIVATGGTGTRQLQGTSISMAKDGNLFVIGSIGDDGSKGSATIFVRNASGQWTQKKRLPAPNINSSLFGTSVSVSARAGVIVVGESNILRDGGYGELSSYSGRPDADYTLTQGISDAPCNYIGKSVAVSPSADFLFAGGPGTPPGEPTRGGACFFVKDAGKWLVKESPVAYQ